MQIRIASDVDEIVMGDGRHEKSGYFISDKMIEGWYGGSGMKTELVDNPTADGAFIPARILQSKRVVTIYGRTFPDSSIDEFSLIDRLNNLIGRKLRLAVIDSSGWRETTAVISDDESIIVTPLAEYNDFTLILDCPDPLKYSPPKEYENANGSILVENNGLMPSWPKLRVDGTASKVTVGFNGSTLVWAFDSTEDKNAELDFSTMIPQAGHVTVGAGFQIPPGRHRISVTTEGDARVTLSVRSAWR